MRATPVPGAVTAALEAESVGTTYRMSESVLYPTPIKIPGISKYVNSQTTNTLLFNQVWNTSGTASNGMLLAIYYHYLRTSTLTPPVTVSSAVSPLR